MYQFKEIYTLDFSKVNYINEVHQIIKDELDFPDHYGMNWDACWDCLTDMVGDPIHIELIGLERVQNKFPRHAKIMLDISESLIQYYTLIKNQDRTLYNLLMCYNNSFGNLVNVCSTESAFLSDTFFRLKDGNISKDELGVILSDLISSLAFCFFLLPLRCAAIVR